MIRYIFIYLLGHKFDLYGHNITRKQACPFYEGS